jgi:hypothetical protein
MCLQSAVEGQWFWCCNISCSISDEGKELDGPSNITNCNTQTDTGLKWSWVLTVNSHGYINCVKRHQMWPCYRFRLRYDKTVTGKVARYLFLHYCPHVKYLFSQHDKGILWK